MGTFKYFYAVGEKINFYDCDIREEVVLEVVNEEDAICEGCYFNRYEDDSCYYPVDVDEIACDDCGREDETSVVFVKVK